MTTDANRQNGEVTTTNDLASPTLDSWSRRDWRQVWAMATVIALLHLIGFTLLFQASSSAGQHATIGIGTGLLAYSLGMRHAFDIDHIAAIDGTTRKLLHDGKRPLSVGFFFSLGHSSVVGALTLALGLGAHALGPSLADGSSFRSWMTTIGTLVSGLFLLAIATMNVVVLRSILRSARTLRAGESSVEAFEETLQQRGFFARLTQRFTSSITRPRQMYGVGLLFGLGFDTASEVGLLVLAGAVVVGGLPLVSVMALPILFAAGMSLFDTLDGCFMHVAYAWALARPARAIFYNVVVTGLSIAIAVIVAVIELSNLAAHHLHLHGAPWDTFASLSSSQTGLIVLVCFVLLFGGALAGWKLFGIEDRLSAVREDDLD